MGWLFKKHDILLLGVALPAPDGKGYRTLFVKGYRGLNALAELVSNRFGLFHDQ